MIRIRPFSPTDISSILKVVEKSLGETYPPSLYLTVHNLWGEGFLVALENKEIVAFVAAVPSGSKVARVLMVAVVPRSRRRSIGQRLMEELCSNCRARGLETIILEVRKSNKEALAFYERQGFSVFGEIKEFYTNGEDAWKLMKVLDT